MEGAAALSPVEYGILAVVALAICALAWLPFKGQLSAWKELRASRAWSVADGTIRSARAAVAQTTDADDVISRSHYLEVKYTYTVGGREYVGTRGQLGEPGHRRGSRRSVERELSRFHEGAKVSVHYDPENPRRSTLARRAPSAELAWWFGWTVSVLVASATACGLLSRILASRAP